MLRVQDYFVVVVLEDATGGKVVEAVYRCYGNGGRGRLALQPASVKNPE